eukprot:614615-Hanusia_phi.AAC.1
MSPSKPEALRENGACADLWLGQGCASFAMPGEDLQHDGGHELLSRWHHEMRVRLINKRS